MHEVLNEHDVVNRLKSHKLCTYMDKPREYKYNIFAVVEDDTDSKVVTADEAKINDEYQTFCDATKGADEDELSDSDLYQAYVDIMPFHITRHYHYERRGEERELRNPSRDRKVAKYVSTDNEVKKLFCTLQSFTISFPFTLSCSLPQPLTLSFNF